jgi:probable phosphomutase (TIGR03848 family)
MAKILLIRHATNDTVSKRIAARVAGVHLNEEGNQQANAIAERLTHLKISAIYSSPLERAIETAAPLASKLNLPINKHGGLLEIDFGEWTNKTIDELKTIALFHQFNSFRSGTRIPGGETMAEAQLRIIKCMDELNQIHHNDIIALFSHADMIKSAIAYFAGINIDFLHRIEISPASVSAIQIFDAGAEISLLNHTGNIII